MKLIIFLTSFLISCQATLLFDIRLANDVVDEMSTIENFMNPNLCTTVQLNYCQSAFNQATMLPIDLYPENGTAIFNAIQQKLSQGPDEVMEVCVARKRFAQCVGSTYSNCMNINYLAYKTSFAQAFDYVKTFRQLDHMCNRHVFPETVLSYECLTGFPTTAAYQNCVTQFNQTVTADNLCNPVITASTCFKNAYQTACGNAESAQFGCQGFYTTFEEACQLKKVC